MAFNMPLWPSQTTWEGLTSAHFNSVRNISHEAWHSRTVGDQETGMCWSPSPAMSNMQVRGITEVASRTRTRTEDVGFGLGGVNQNGWNHLNNVRVVKPCSKASSVRDFLLVSHRTNKNNRVRSRLSLRLRIPDTLQDGQNQRAEPAVVLPHLFIDL